MSTDRASLFAERINEFADHLHQDTKFNAQQLFLELAAISGDTEIGLGYWPTVRFTWPEPVEVEVFADRYEFYHFQNGRTEICEYPHSPDQPMTDQLIAKLRAVLIPRLQS